MSTTEPPTDAGTSRRRRRRSARNGAAARDPRSRRRRARRRRSPRSGSASVIGSRRRHQPSAGGARPAPAATHRHDDRGVGDDQGEVPVAAHHRLQPLRLWIGGDSLAGLARAVARQHDRGDGRRRSRVYDSRVSSGLANPKFFDWPEHATERDGARSTPRSSSSSSARTTTRCIYDDLDRERSTAAHRWKPCTRCRSSRCCRSSSGIAPGTTPRTVYWVGAPILKDTKMDAGAAQVNEVAQRGRSPATPSVTYVDAHTLFADDRRRVHSRRCPTQNGKPVAMRAGDGIHLTGDGGDHLADAVFQLPRRALPRGGPGRRRLHRSRSSQTKGSTAGPRHRAGAPSGGSRTGIGLERPRRPPRAPRHHGPARHHGAPGDRSTDHRPPRRPTSPPPSTPTRPPARRLSAADRPPERFRAVGVGRLPGRGRTARSGARRGRRRGRRWSAAAARTSPRASAVDGRISVDRARPAPGARLRPRARGERGRGLPGDARVRGARRARGDARAHVHRRRDRRRRSPADRPRGGVGRRGRRALAPARAVRRRRTASPQFLESVADAAPAARHRPRAPRPTSSTSSATASTASPRTRSARSPSTSTATNDDIPEDDHRGHGRARRLRALGARGVRRVRGRRRVRLPRDVRRDRGALVGLARRRRRADHAARDPHPGHREGRDRGAEARGGCRRSRPASGRRRDGHRARLRLRRRRRQGDRDPDRRRLPSSTA